MASLGSRTLAIATRSAATPSGARDLSTSSCTTPLHFSARRSTPTPKLGPPSPANSLASTTSRTTQQSGPDEPSDFLAASSPQSEKQRRHRRRGQDDQPPPCADQPNARDADHPNGRSNTASRPIRHVSKPAIVQSPDRPTATKEQEVRSPRNSATTPASRQVPLSASATTTGPTARALPERGVGATSIALGTSLVIENMVVLAGAPTYWAPIEEVLAFHAEHRGSVAIAVGLEALSVPLLLGFLTGLHGLVGRRGGAGVDWSRLAVAAGASFSAVFAFYAVLWDGVVLSAGKLAEPSPVLALAWHMHAAAFALALPALGTTFIGAALATHAIRLTPRWQLLLGVAGGGLLLAAGAASLVIADSSALLYVGVPGYFAWMAWLLATGVRLVRARTANRLDNA